MKTGRLAAIAAAMVCWAGAPAGAQDIEWWDFWAIQENPPTAAQIWASVAQAEASGDMDDMDLYLARSRAASKVGSYLRNDRNPAEARDAAARGLADLIIADTSAENAAIAGHIARHLARAALADHRFYSKSGKIGHRASYDALARVFEALEPPPLCERSEWENHIPLQPGDPGYRQPCQLDPRMTAWCLAGEALHGPEVNRKIIRKGYSTHPAPSDPPEVRGLSQAAALWWGRCWDGRR